MKSFKNAPSPNYFSGKMVKLKHGAPVSGPSSSLGIMRFFDADTAGPKMSPEFVIATSIIVLIIVIGAKVVFGL